MTCKKDWVRRAIAFAGAVIITVNVVAAPKRAQALAVTATVVASVAAILTACGITYWANTQEDAVQYLGSKIDSYLWGLADGGPVMTYQEWLGVDSVANLFEVTANGAMKVGGVALQAILNFVDWFNDDTVVPAEGELIKAGGSNVQLWVNLDPDYTDGNDAKPSLAVTDTGNVNLFWEGAGLSTKYSHYVGITIPRQASSVRVTVDSFRGGNDVYWSVTSGSSGDYGAIIGGASYQAISTGSSKYISYIGSSEQLFIQLSAPDPAKTYALYLTLSFSWVDTPLVPHNVALQPAASSLAIPDVGVGEDLEVLPNVPLLPTMSVEQATDAILGGVASEEGLSSEVDSGTEGGALEGWGWLQQLLQRIERAISGTQEQTAPAQYEAIDDYALDLTSFFPFCLPWDIHRGLSLLVAEPVAPSINWTVPLPGGGTYTLALDLSEWDGVAQVARTMELLAFVVALAVATKKLIKW